MNELSRRTFIKTVSCVPLGGLLQGCSTGNLLRESSRLSLPLPTKAQLEWQRLERAVLFSYDLHVCDNKRYRQGQNRITPIADINIFNPVQCDTDQWLESAKAMGAKFAFITASHETGFRLFQSEVNPYCMKALKWRNGKGDLVRDFVNSCRKYNIKPCIYYGARWNSHLGVLDFKVTEKAKISQKQYNKLVEQEVKQLCTQYGELFELWFDGGILAHELGGPDILDMFNKYQPECVYYHSRQRSDVRWGGSEAGTVSYPCWGTMPYKGSRGHVDFNLLKHGDPDGKYYSPAMADAPLRNHEWFWEPDDEKKIYSLDALVNMYYKSVGRNATLFLGATPDDRGLVPDADFERMSQFGKEIGRIFSRPVASCSSRGDEIILKLKKPARIDHVVIQEDLQFGQRVREYSVDILTPEGFKNICSGSSIGNKRIEKFAAVEAGQVRLSIKSSVGEPVIGKMSVYSAG